MDAGSVWLSLLSSAVIFMVLVVVYTCQSMSPVNAEVNYPKLLLLMKPRSSLALGSDPSAWLRKSLSSTQKDIITTSGLDSAVYFIFYETVLKIFLSGVVLLPILLPLAVMDTTSTMSSNVELPLAAMDSSTKSSNDTSSGTFNFFNNWSMGHIEENSLTLYAFVAATYWISLFTVNLLEKAYDRVSNLRAAALMSTEMRPEEFAVLVRDIPPPSQGQSRKEQVDSYFKAIYPDAYHGSLVFTDNETIDKIWEELEWCKKKLARAKAIHSESEEKNLEWSTPTIKTGFFGLMGKEVDSIEYYSEKVKELALKLKAKQMIVLKENQQPAALVFFTSTVAASSVAQSLINQRVNEWTLTHAPEARQLLWSHTDMDSSSRHMDKFDAFMGVFLGIMAYVIPINYLSLCTTVDHSRELTSFFKLPMFDKYAMKIVWEAFLPQIILMGVMSILPKSLLILARYGGNPSLSCVERDAAEKYFFFTVLDVIIGVTAYGTLIASWKEIGKNPEAFVSILASTLPANATFFMTFVAFKAFVIYGLELSRLVPLVIFHLKKYICKTKENENEAWAPVSLGYATRLPGDMLVFVVVLCYSVISPIILLVGILYFLIGWLVLRNQVLHVFVPSYESYGSWWPHINNHILASLFVFQVMMICYLGLKRCYWGCVLVVPLLVIMLIYVWSFETRYSRFFSVRSLGVTCRRVMSTKRMDKIIESFIPPSLKDVEELADDECLIPTASNGERAKLK